MTDVRADGQWPAWARYAIFAGLAAVVVAGIVVAASSGGLEGPALRVVVAAVVIPALLAPLQLLGVRRRSDRVRERLAGELAAVEDAVASERSTPPGTRATGASDEALGRVASWVRSTRDQAATGSGEQVADSVEQLARMTADWPAEAPLAQAVARCRTSARTLSRTSRRPDAHR